MTSALASTRGEAVSAAGVATAAMVGGAVVKAVRKRRADDALNGLGETAPASSLSRGDASEVDDLDEGGPSPEGVGVTGSSAHIQY